jgi:hypothetical protein
LTAVPVLIMVFAGRGDVHDPHTAVFGALDPADQTPLHETIHGGTDRARGQIDDRPYRIDRQRPFVVFHALMAPSGLALALPWLCCGRTSSSTSDQPLAGYSTPALRRKLEEGRHRKTAPCSVTNIGNKK